MGTGRREHGKALKVWFPTSGKSPYRKTGPVATGSGHGITDDGSCFPLMFFFFGRFLMKNASKIGCMCVVLLLTLGVLSREKASASSIEMTAAFIATNMFLDEMTVLDVPLGDAGYDHFGLGKRRLTVHEKIDAKLAELDPKIMGGWFVSCQFPAITGALCFAHNQNPPHNMTCEGSLNNCITSCENIGHPTEGICDWEQRDIDACIGGIVDVYVCCEFPQLCK